MTIQHDIEHPWYRQFWPWFLILLPATAVVASIYTMIIAAHGADDLVVDDYYKNGLAINRQLTRQQEAKTMGISATLQTEGRDVSIRIPERFSFAQLRLRLSHPMEADRDMTLALHRVAPGIYQSKLPQAISGQWIWTVDVGDGSRWRLDGENRF
ncbi:conserved hypothetical protein [Luminiphilus syltensis NOR5-1B]|uniref:FixH family protein n=1 Tax=Luminiphilus syltensis NOR5-1B TaxID=565045 RepID=B8KR15_9GAMM|nr:FixH family protein [Luminiphilus syltensis]EED36396.1 conserved hypothetical protein [Luminiphilus syltensis NOR5-1B]